MATTTTTTTEYLDALPGTHTGRAVLRELYGPEWRALLDSADDDTRAAMAQEVGLAMHRRYPTIF